MKRVVKGATALAVSAVAVAGCSTSESAGPPRVVKLDASWAEGYPTVRQMASHTTAIAQVRVERIDGTESADGAVYTDFSASVLKWTSSSTGTPQTIRIRQLGGLAGNVSYVVDDDPLLRPGDQQLVFLREYSSGQYVIQGGPTGHLAIDGSTLRALPGSSMARSFPAPVSKTITTIRAAISAGGAKSKLVG